MLSDARGKNLGGCSRPMDFVEAIAAVLCLLTEAIQNF